MAGQISELYRDPRACRADVSVRKTFEGIRRVGMETTFNCDNCEVRQQPFDLVGLDEAGANIMVKQRVSLIVGWHCRIIPRDEANPTVVSTELLPKIHFSS